MFSLLNPGRWLLYGAFLAALLLGVWRLDVSRQQIGYDRAVAEYTKIALKAEQVARAKEQSLQAQIVKAQNDAKTRETKLAASAAATRRVADSLRSDLASARRDIASASRAAVDRYAQTASAVLGECTREYETLAGTTAGIASDALTLLQAWPR